MRLVGLHLRNYVGIYNGLGLHELNIDFSRAVHRICVIKGDNGSGKSTILKAINPDNDPSKEFMPGEDAMKSISYMLDDGGLLTITHTSIVTKNGRTTSTHVVKNDNDSSIDLNPNGNVNEGKRIIHDMLGIDDDFLVLAQLSSDDRGLADKTPSERKRFVNSKLSQLDFYNMLYKKLIKKSTGLKSILTSITSKMDSLGNIEQIKSSIKSMESSMGDMEDRRNLLIASIATKKEKLNALSDVDNTDIITEYNQLKDELQSVNIEIESCKNRLNGNIIEDDFESKFMYTIATIDSEVKHLEDTIKKLIVDQTDVSKRIDSNAIKLSSFGDYAILEDIGVRSKALLENIEYCKSQFSQIGFSKYESVTQNEYETAVKFIERAKNMIQRIRDTYDDDVINRAYNRAEEFFVYDAFVEKKFKDTIDTLKHTLEEQSRLRSKCSSYDDIPKDCDHLSDCPFIRDIVKSKESLLDDDTINNTMKMLESTEESLSNYQDESAKEAKAIQCKSLIDDIYSSIPSGITSKFDGLYWLDSYDQLCVFILSNDQVAIDTSAYLNRSNLIMSLKTSTQELQKLEEQKKALEQNQTEVDRLNSELKEDKSKFDSLRLEIEKAKKALNTAKENSSVEKANLDSARIAYSIQTRLSNLNTRKDTIEDKLPSLKASFTAAASIKEDMDKEYSELEKLNTELLPALQDSLQESKYKIVLYTDYLHQYKQYKEEFDITEKIKYYTSPNTGIQTVYMEMFMNGILSTSNELLKSFFGGEFVLHPFIINEKEFRMPCLGKGIMNDDISSMSTAQICMISMIVSFALLRSTSMDYSIIKLDEIDGGLDPQNRLQFITVLNHLMDLLHYEQCVMISHNSELSMYNADIIVLRNSDPSLNLSGNIIYKFGE